MSFSETKIKELYKTKQKQPKKRIYSQPKKESDWKGPNRLIGLSFWEKWYKRRFYKVAYDNSLAVTAHLINRHQKKKQHSELDIYTFNCLKFPSLITAEIMLRRGSMIPRIDILPLQNVFHSKNGMKNSVADKYFVPNDTNRFSYIFLFCENQNTIYTY